MVSDRDKTTVAHIITLLELGGAQQNTIYTVTHLNRKHFRPLLITGKGGYLDHEVISSHAIPVEFIPTLVRSINPLLDIFSFLWIWRVLRRHRPVIVHTHSSKAGIIGRWAAFFARIPVIIHTYHGFGFNEFQSNFLRFLYVTIERLTARITDRLICVSRDNITYALSKKIGTRDTYVLIRSGIPLKDYTTSKINKDRIYDELKIRRNSRIITMIACFKPQKNCPDFVRMASILARKADDLPKIAFLLVGDGLMRPAIQKEIWGEGLDEWFRLPGWHRNIPAILAATDIFVLTSLWEGLPRVVVEALVSGVPVVAYSTDGVKDVVKDGKNGFLCKPRDISDLARKVNTLLIDDSIRSAMSQNARRSISKEFDIDEMVKRQEKMYNELLVPSS